MTDPLSLTYTLTMDDVIAWSQYHCLHSALYKRTFWIWRVAMSVALFVLIVASYPNVAGVCIASLLVVVTLVLAHILRRPRLVRYVKKAYAEGKNTGMIGQHRLVVTDDGLASSNAVGEGKSSWAGIERIIEIPGYTFVCFGALQAGVVPERGVLEGNYNAFMAELKRRWEAAQASES